MSDLIAVIPRVAGLFGVGGLVLWGVRRRPDIAVLTARLRTWLLIAVVWFAALALGRAGVVVLATGCGVIAATECARLTIIGHHSRRVVIAAGGSLPLATMLGGTRWLVVLAVVLLACTIPPLVTQDLQNGFSDLAASCMTVLWIGATCSALAVLPLPLLPLLGVATATADIGGFVGGATLGRHPLAARLSPHKTWEGLLGAAVLATVGAAITADVAGLALWSAPLLGGAVAVASTWGDLLESLVKRTAGCKDAGSWLPGFGGLLDRVDSLLVTAPLAWAVLVLSS
ncbi:MAG: phosphatidate cytidylyltransferase [Euzebya sp.]